MGKANGQELNRKTVRQALRAWERAGRLGQGPLAGLAVVERKRALAGYSESDLGYGLAVRELLQEAVDQLKPNAGPSDPLDAAWRSYLIVTEQYIEGRAKGYLSEQMGIAESTYDHTQADALDRLAQLLREWEATGDSGQAAAPRRAAARAAGVVVPFTAPPALPHGLVGRVALLSDLRRRLLDGAAPARLALYGLPGVGKTSLAAALCHDQELRARYSDGVLWAGLGPQPDPAVPLHLWEIALGFTAEELAALPKADDRARALHAAIGARSMLLVIDDVWEGESAKLLEVGGPACAYLYTTRLPGLAVELAEGGAVQVPELDPEASLEVLGRLAPQLAGELRSRGTELVEALAGLPLALQLVGSAIRQQAYASNPRRLIEALDRLSEPAERLQVDDRRSVLYRQLSRAKSLQGPGLPDDFPHSLAAVIGLSEQMLDPAARAAFASLSVFPPKPSTFSEQAALAVTAQPPDMLDRLVDAGLVEPAGPDRYAIHPVLHDYAATRLEGTEAVANLATHAVGFIRGHHADFPKLDSEITNLLAGLEAGHEHGAPADFIEAANALYPYFDASGLLDQADRHLRRAASLAEAVGLNRELAETCVNLGRVLQRQSDSAEAEAWYSNALRLARDNGLTELECASLQGLGALAYSQGSFDVALEHFEAGLALAEGSHMRSLQSSLLSNLGTLAAATGDPALAEQRYRAGLALARSAGDLPIQIILLSNLGAVLAQRGNLDQAQACLEEGFELTRAAGNRRHMATLLSNLGALEHDRGDPEGAAKWLDLSRRYAGQIGDLERTCRALASLGALATEVGNFTAAMDRLDAALATAHILGNAEIETLVLINRSELFKAMGETNQAEQMLIEAQALASDSSGSRYAEEATRRLLRLGN